MATTIVSVHGHGVQKGLSSAPFFPCPPPISRLLPTSLVELSKLESSVHEIEVSSLLATQAVVKLEVLLVLPGRTKNFENQNSQNMIKM